MASPRVLVLSLEGEPGVGKSHIWRLLKTGIHLDEGFVTNPKDPLSPQSFSRELEWVVKYYKRIRLACKPHLQADDGDKLLVVTDRSPYSGCVFAESGRELLRGATAMLEEEVAALGVQFLRVRVVAELAVVKRRVRERLSSKGESWRLSLHEDDEDHLLRVRGKYDDMSDLWDYIIENGDDEDPMKGVRAVKAILEEMGF